MNEKKEMEDALKRAIEMEEEGRQFEKNTNIYAGIRYNFVIR